MNIREFFMLEKKLKMVWEVMKGDRKSYLIGAAHFFPYSFKRSLTQYIKKADRVLLEGPLDENSMSKVVEHGLTGDMDLSLGNAIDDRIIKEINKLEYAVTTPSFYGTYVATFGQSLDKSLFGIVKGQKPWMAFFNIWFYYREKKGWKYKMDIDTLKVAERLGKEIHFLESIDEQLEALNGIPLERVVNFLTKIEEWDGYAKRYTKHYLGGDLEGLLSGAKDFPTFCDSIIDKRDPVLCKRMKPFLEKGKTLAVVGITHIRGIKKMLLGEGFSITPARPE